MKYTLNINQKAIIDSGFNIDLIDAAILELFKSVSISNNLHKKQSEGKIYFLLKWEFIIKELPIIGISSRKGIYCRLKKLCDCDLIEPHFENGDGLSGSYYTLGANVGALEFNKEPVTESTQHLLPKVPSPVTKNTQPLGNLGNTYNNTIDNNIINNNKEVFEKFRTQYLGSKRGLDTEFLDFKKHKDWAQCLDLILPSLEKQIKIRELRKSNGLFVPEWKNLKTWISQRCWEEETKVEESVGDKIKSEPIKTYRDKINEDLEKKAQLIEVKKEEIDVPEY